MWYGLEHKRSIFPDITTNYEARLHYKMNLKYLSLLYFHHGQCCSALIDYLLLMLKPISCSSMKIGSGRTVLVCHKQKIQAFCFSSCPVSVFNHDCSNIWIYFFFPCSLTYDSCETFYFQDGYGRQ